MRRSSWGVVRRRRIRWRAGRCRQTARRGPGPRRGAAARRLRRSSIAVAVAAARHGAAIPVLPCADALKRVDGDRVIGAADGSRLFRAQTPQGARRELLVGRRRRLADGPRGVRRRGGAAGASRRPGGDRAGGAGEPQGHRAGRPGRLRSRRTWCRRHDAHRDTATGHDSHPFGGATGCASAAWTSPRRTAAPRPLRRRRRPPRPV